MPDIKLASPSSSERPMRAGDTASSHNKPHHDNHDDAHKEENMNHLPVADREKLETQKLLDTQNEILQAVSDSDFYQLAGKQQQQQPSRQYPVFDADEIIIGPRLGIGGFGIVFEVAEIKLKEENRSNPTENGMAAKNSDRDDNSENHKEEGKQRTANKIVDDLDDDNDGEEEEEDMHDDQKHADVHYDVASAREFMAQHVRRRARRNSPKNTGAENTTATNNNHQHPHHHNNNNNYPDGDEPEGDARYAIKRLHQTLSEYERTRGMIDMAIEAKFLQVLWHPNIVKMRGMATGPLVDPHFFIIMDRLYETLAERMPHWRRTFFHARGGFCGFGANRPVLHNLLLERMVVAYDIAAAFTYMHDHKLIYRDIKNENFGFDVRGDIKVFDFGLAKSANASLRAKDKDGREAYGYNLTPRTGTIPFMAPEVAMCEPYDEKCDVYSFAILLWEIISLRPAFPGLNRRNYVENIVEKKQRLPIGRGKMWPPLTRMLLKDAWDPEPQKRPDMRRVSTILRGDLNDLSNDSRIRNRTQHMKNRSAHSMRGERMNQYREDSPPLPPPKSKHGAAM